LLGCPTLWLCCDDWMFLPGAFCAWFPGLVSHAIQSVTSPRQFWMCRFKYLSDVVESNVQSVVSIYMLCSQSKQNTVSIEKHREWQTPQHSYQWNHHEKNAKRTKHHCNEKYIQKGVMSYSRNDPLQTHHQCCCRTCKW
jgi:hypothetical protein